MEKKWSWLGSYEREARNSLFAMALSIYIAAETFGAHEHRYKVLMSLLVLISAAYISTKAWASRSIVGAFTVLVSLIWIIPLVDPTFFYSVDLTFMVAHSALALSVAVGAFTYMKN